MKKITIVATILISTSLNAQDMKIVKGDFNFLKGEKEINVEFDFSNVILMKEEKSEAQYVEERTKELNEKNNGVGDEWKKNWASSKELIWIPKFLELVNIVLSKEKKDMSFNEEVTTAKYTLIVETVWIYLGWDAGVMKQAAKVTTLLKFVETANKSNVLLEITSKEAPGDKWGNN